MNHLLQAALETDDDDLRWSYVSKLHLGATPERLPELFDLAQAEAAKRRTLAADILGQVHASPPVRAAPPCVSEAIDRTLLTLLDDEDIAVLDATIKAAGHRSIQASLPRLDELARHTDADVRAAVAFALTHEFGAAAAPSLIALCRDSAVEVCTWAALGLAELLPTEASWDTEAREVLLALVGREDGEVRGEALIGLARAKDERALAPLIAELQAQTVGTLAVEAAEVLADPRLLSSLHELSRWWRVDEDLLKRAITACQ